MPTMYVWLRRQPWLYDLEHDSLRLPYRRLAHGFLRGLTWASALRHRYLPPAWRAAGQDMRLNLGSGREPLPAWINVDINPFARAEVWMDLRNPWPFADGEVHAIYMRHCLEHFPETEVLAILAKCYRALRPGGGVRIGVPSLAFALQQYQAADFTFAPWVRNLAKSPGRQFFLYMMDNGAHGIMFDYGYLAELLELAGFREPVERKGGQSGFLEPELLAPKDNAHDHATLYVECRK